jgi:hypothetical protein
LAHDEPIWRAINETLDFLRSHESADFIDVGQWIDGNSAAHQYG